MDQYRVINRLKKTKDCTYYNVQHIRTKQIFTIKKIYKNISLDEFIKAKQILIMRQAKYDNFPIIKQIIKQNNYFYIVYPELENNLHDLRNQKLHIDEIISISKQMLEILLILHQQNIIPEEIRPQYFFLVKKQLKLCHLQFSFKKDISQLQLTQIQDFKYLPPEIVLSNAFTGKILNSFSIACIISELFLGKTLIYAKSKLDYMYVICNLFPKQQLYQMQHKKIKFVQQFSFDYFMKNVCSQYQLIKILNKMLEVDYKQRYSIEQSLQKIKNLYQKNLKSDQEIMPITLSNQKNKSNKSKPKQVIKSSFSPKLKNKINNNKMIKKTNTNAFLTMNLDNSLNQDISQLPSLPKFTKPLPMQRYIRDYDKKVLSPKSQTLLPKVSESLNKTLLPQGVTPIKVHKKNTINYKKRVLTQAKRNFSIKKPLGTTQIHQKNRKVLNLSPPQLTNYAVVNASNSPLKINYSIYMKNSLLEM